MRVCVCVCGCLNVCMCLNVSMYLHVCVCVYVYVSECICVCTCMYECVCDLLYVRVRVCVKLANMENVLLSITIPPQTRFSHQVHVRGCLRKYELHYSGPFTADKSIFMLLFISLVNSLQLSCKHP